MNTMQKIGGNLFENSLVKKEDAHLYLPVASLHSLNIDGVVLPQRLYPRQVEIIEKVGILAVGVRVDRNVINRWLRPFRADGHVEELLRIHVVVVGGPPRVTDNLVDRRVKRPWHVVRLVLVAVHGVLQFLKRIRINRPLESLLPSTNWRDHILSWLIRRFTLFLFFLSTRRSMEISWSYRLG